MKLCELNLQELGDSPATHTPNRKRTRSLFHATVDGHWVDVYFEHGFFNTVQIVFVVNGETEIPQHQKNKEGSPSKSKVKILSTVLDIIKQQLPVYIKKVRPRRVSFTGDGASASRIELYRKRMVPFMNELLGPQWAHEEESHRGKVHFFTWVKKD